MSYVEKITEENGVQVTTRLIRVRQDGPGRWVPDDDGPSTITVQVPPDPHGDGCRCMWCQAVAAGMVHDAHRAVIRARGEALADAYTAHLAGPLTRDELRYLEGPATEVTEFQPEPVAYPALTLADLDDAITAFRAAKDKSLLILASEARFTPRGPVLRSCGVTGPAVSSGYGPEAVPPLSQEELARMQADWVAAQNRPPVVLPQEKTLATGTCRHCGGQLNGQVLAEADERGCFAYCAAGPYRKHEAGPALELSRFQAGPFSAIAVERPGRTEPEPEQMDPADAIRAALYEPLMLDEAALDELAPYGRAGPGLCSQCLVSKALAVNPVLCYYCDLAKRLAAGQAPACGRTEVVAWVKGTCGCTSAHDHEMARRRVTCRHSPRLQFVRDGQCRRCGAQVTGVQGTVTSLTPVVLMMTACMWAAIAIVSGIRFAYLPAFLFLAASVTSMARRTL